MAGYNFGNYPGYGNNAAQQQLPTNSMIAFINDNTIVSNYPVAPGTTVALINANDPQNSKMFLKSTATNGMPSPTRIFEIREVTPQPQNPDAVSRQEFESLSQQMAQIQQALQNLQPKKKGAVNNE